MLEMKNSDLMYYFENSKCNSNQMLVIQIGVVVSDIIINHCGFGFYLTIL